MLEHLPHLPVAYGDTEINVARERIAENLDAIALELEEGPGLMPDDAWRLAGLVRAFANDVRPRS